MGAGQSGMPGMPPKKKDAKKKKKTQRPKPPSHVGRKKRRGAGKNKKLRFLKKNKNRHTYHTLWKLTFFCFFLHVTIQCFKYHTPKSLTKYDTFYSRFFNPIWKFFKKVFFLWQTLDYITTEKKEVYQKVAHKIFSHCENSHFFIFVT